MPYTDHDITINVVTPCSFCATLEWTEIPIAEITNVLDIDSYIIPNTLANDQEDITWSKVCGYSNTIVTDLPYWIVFSSETQTITSSPQTYEDH